MASDSWFYSDGGRSFGPVAEDVMQCLITDGTVGREHFVMEEGKEDWEKVPESQFAPYLDQIWYYSDTKETFGPCSEAALRELIEKGSITPETFVMRASDTDWTTFKDSKFSSIKIKGPKTLKGTVAPTPMRRPQPLAPPRPKAEVRTDGGGDDAPPAPRKPSETDSEKSKKSEASVPAVENQTADKLKKLTKELAAVKTESEEWMRRVAEAERERGDALKESKESTKKLAETTTELTELNRQLDRSVSGAEKAKLEIANLREDLGAAENKIEESTKSKAESEKRIFDLEAKLSKAEQPDPSQEKRIKGLESELAEAGRTLKRTEEQLSTAESRNAKGDAGELAAKVKRLNVELVETSALLAKAKERQPVQEKRIRELESELAKASSKLSDAKTPVTELSKRVKELESQLENAGGAAKSADQKLVRTWEEKFAKAKSEAETARADLAKTKNRVKEAEEKAAAERPPAKSSKLAWATAFIGILLAGGAGWFAWQEHKRAEDLDGKFAGVRTFETELEKATADLAETQKKLVEAETAAGTKEHSDFAAQLLDRIAAVSGPIDPDLIAELRRETESHFGMADNVDRLDAETAERAGQMIAEGDAKSAAGKHEDARNEYRDASLLIAPLIEKYPSKAFWRGDLITAHTRHAREELALGETADADAALAKAQSHLETLQSDDPKRAALRTGELAAAWELVGDAAAEVGDIERARNGLERALAFRETLEADGGPATARALQTKLGALAVSARQWKVAHQHFQNALSADPEEAEKMRLLADLAKVERNLGKLADAAKRAEEYLAYHRTIAEKQPTPESHREFAKALNLIGEIRRDSADHAGAASAHADATTVLQNLINSHPGDPETQRELAITGVREGEIEMAKKNFAAARARFEENLPTFRMLVGKDPEDIEALRDLEYLHLNIARSHALENDHESALGAYADALRVSELLSAAAPKNYALSRNLADWKVRIGNYQHSLNKLIPARNNLRDALKILEWFASADETDLETKRQIAELNKTLGDLEMKIAPEVAVAPEVIGEAGDPPTDPGGAPTPPIVRNEGEPYYREAIAKAKELVERDPNNTTLKQDLGNNHEKLGAFLMTGSRFPEALGEYQRCLKVRRKLVEDSESPEPIWFHELSRTFYDLAFIESQTGTIGIGEQYYISALNHGTTAVNKSIEKSGGAPAEWIAQNGETYLRLGEIDQAERQLIQARRRFQDAVKILKTLTASHEEQDNWKISLVLAYAGLAANLENGAPTNPALAKSYYVEALEILRKLDAEGKLSPSEKNWIGRLQKKAG